MRCELQDHLVRDVVLVEGKHGVEQPLGVREHLLAGRPEVSFLLASSANLRNGVRV